MSREEEWFQRHKDRIRKRLLKYTRKAFRMLPKLDKPRILDIGCGSGVPTMELARLCNGKITALDIDQDMLDVLSCKVEKVGLSNRIEVVNRSLFDMQLSHGSFDVIWAEGSINIIGFKKGIQEWRRLLSPGGLMVIHDEKDDIEGKLEQVRECGYELLGHFEIDSDTWKKEYFLPLEKLMNQAQSKYQEVPVIDDMLQETMQEIEMFRKDPEHNSSVYFVIKRRANNDK